jgi:dolichol-phosphate mannosyltransferase
MLELAIVIPTLDEAENISPLLARLDAALAGTKWEAVFVDDASTDGTADLIRARSLPDPRIRIVERIGRRGLSSACIEGMLSTAAPYIAVMDADLQHDAKILPAMLEALKNQQLDLVIGSRNLQPEGMGGFASPRQALSRLGAYFSRLVCRCTLTDPMSGFFMLDRRFLHSVVHRLSGIGFKILVDLVASSKRPVRLLEVPYVFGSRLHGSSKLDLNVALEYLLLLADKAFGSWLPVRYVLFGIVGTAGVILHLILLWCGIHLLGLEFSRALVSAIGIVMALNFFGNNQFTYRDQRLRGRALMMGFVSFCAACTIGALTNYKLTETLYTFGLPLYLAAFCGAVTGSVWNYGVTATFTWRRRRQHS